MSLAVPSRAAAAGARLRELADPGRAVQEKRYLKSELVHLGVSVPAVRRVATEIWHEGPPLGREALLALVEELWAGGIHEYRACAVELLELGVGLLASEDIPLLERLLREARTWALVDNLAASVMGPLVEAHPELAKALDRWAADPDFWVRRAALLSLLLPLRRGEGDFVRFCRYADVMLKEREFFIRKAIGWVLRDTGKKRPELVRGWLLPRAGRAAGLTVRQAVRHLPEADREAIRAAREGPR